MALKTAERCSRASIPTRRGVANAGERKNSLRRRTPQHTRPTIAAAAIPSLLSPAQRRDHYCEGRARGRGAPWPTVCDVTPQHVNIDTCRVRPRNHARGRQRGVRRLKNERGRPCEGVHWLRRPAARAAVSDDACASQTAERADGVSSSVSRERESKDAADVENNVGERSVK